MKQKKKTSWIWLLLACLVYCSGAQAAEKAYVSAKTGKDSNNCSFSAPCRNFSKAMAVVDYGGQVNVLASGNYNPFTIDKAVTIQVPAGIYAGIMPVAGTDAITVNALGGLVILEGLVLNGRHIANNGIVTIVANNVHIERCVIQAFTGHGVSFNSLGSLVINDSMIRECDGFGVLLSPGTGKTAVASVDHSTFEGNSTGFYAYAGGEATIRNSVAFRNTNNGFLAVGVGTDPAQLTIDNCLSMANSVGIASIGTFGGSAVVRVSNSTVTDNDTGFSQSGSGVFTTRVNNTVEGNSTNFSGLIWPFNAQ